MSFIKKIVRAYQYIYFRFALFQQKQWNGDENLKAFNTGYAISFSSVALIYSLDLLIRRISDFEGFFVNSYRIFGLVIIVFILNVLLFRKDDEILYDKFSQNKESNLSWRIKGFFCLFYIFGPIILLMALLLL
ncbi:hypothetical protein [Mesonia aestuariivivens]|uniref:Uncharacterized protein n=1 Tax=Mesonia aestuariivivens TaxID=2796128 RepID=A0ABS6W2R8_9FLAO|nr:hypothetical protein [Mesonia aestuariivivens]MBW2962109.1 hypothetical protein [Mesonia aestuariivivens]